MVLYFVHILLMKFNTLYEVAIKKNVARGMEIKELTYVANTNIDHFHRNLNSRSITIEMLKILEVLRKANIVHADIKPENFLLQRT